MPLVDSSATLIGMSGDLNVLTKYCLFVFLIKMVGGLSFIFFSLMYKLISIGFDNSKYSHNHSMVISLSVYITLISITLPTQNTFSLGMKLFK